MRGRYKLADVCFYIFWSFLQVGKGLGYTARDTEFLILVACGAPFAVGKILLTKWTRNDLIKFILLISVGLLTMIGSGTSTYLLSIFCITLAKDMNIENVLKTNVLIRLPMFVCRTSLAILGYADMQIAYRYESGAEAVVRYALGYGNPNTTQFELLMLTILWFLVYAKKTGLLHYVLAALFNVFIYKYTGSRTPIAVVLVFLIGAYLLTRKWEVFFSKIIDFWSGKSWIVGTLFSIIGCMAYVFIPAFRDFGNFSSRFLTAVLTIENNNLPLFGTDGITTDLGYVYILYSGGVVITTLFFCGIHQLLKLDEYRKKTILRWAFACMAVVNMMEHTGYSVISNSLLLYLVRVIYKRQEKQQEQGSDNNRIGRGWNCDWRNRVFCNRSKRPAQTSPIQNKMRLNRLHSFTKE